jgi:hypothetical protein
MLLLGVEKIGKTSFACGCSFEGAKRTGAGLNSPIILPMQGEEGADDMHVASFPTIQNSAEVLDALGVLYSEDHEYKTVVIDSASALEPLIWDDVSRAANVRSIEQVGGGYGKGYQESASVFRRVLDGLDALRAAKNMASIIVGHVKIKRFDDPTGDSYDTYQFDAHERVKSLISRWADVILFAGVKVVVKKEDQGFGKEKRRGVDITGGSRFLWTQKRPAHPGGGRGIYGQLPYELPLVWTAFEAEVSRAMEEATEIK